MTDGTEAGPFGRAVALYRAAGWTGAMPIGRGPRQKSPPPTAFTGHGKPYPSGADVQAWLDDPRSHGLNIGLRMPTGVIGLDIDAGYTKVEHGKEVVKRGEDTLRDLEARYGSLPPTWVSSARPAPSGIRFYRVPTHLDGREINWPGEAGKFIEIIQPGHRYAVVWPSINPDAGGAAYQWRHEESPFTAHDVGGQCPTPTSLAHLPEAWVRGLALPYDRTEKADIALGDLAQWWESLRDGSPCAPIHSVWTRAVDGLRNDAGSRHETARDALSAIVRFGGAGHRGAPAAVAELATAFAEAVGAERVAGGEWERLVAGAVRIAATDNRMPQQHCEHDPGVGLTGEALADLGFTVPEAATATLPVAEPAPGSLTLPLHFWEARESLKRIRQAAHSRLRSADVVLAGLLCRMAAMTPHTLRADTGIGSPASLNLFAAVVGPSGSGKSSGLSVTRDLVKSTYDLDEFPLGSGEGVAEAYMGEALEGTGQMDKLGEEKKTKVRKQVRHNALFHSDEGASLNKLIERAGSTVGETLRSAWSGEAIGQKNGRTETTRTIAARSYSCGLLIGYQPTTVLPLLADYEAGTPQRFLYVWAVDATIPGRQQRVPWPGEIANPFPPSTPTTLPPPGTLVAAPPLNEPQITFAADILDELYDQEHAKSTGTLPAGHWLLDPETGELDPFRSQHPVLKVKVASELALLEGRRHVDGEDWALAQIYLDTSDRVRGYLQAVARWAAGKVRAAQLAAEGEAEQHRAHARAKVADSLDLTAETRIAVRLAQRVHDDGPMTMGRLRATLAGRERHLAEAAVERAMAAGWLAVGESGRAFGPGSSRPV